MACPTENTWVRYLAGNSEPVSITDLEHHLDGCASCQLLYAGIARNTTAPPVAIPLELGRPDLLARGTAVGRYLIAGPLGQGGMGVVYKAFDPELDRPVAIKLVKFSGDADEARLRLVAEAKALAKLSHPNVVSVHDVGEYGEDTFIAIEFVAGVTLRTWLGQKTRSPEEIIGVFCEAGAGLGAAHKVGIIHRDFKPDNVMVGDDGRVRVLDFGLARSDTRLVRGLSGAEEAAPTALEVTREGVVVGTPAYMAPEQDLGNPVDARTDQFSFCASLYEALFGQRAFAGERYADICAHRMQGEVRPPPSVGRVSARVRDAVMRGLRVAPAERHPNMELLLAELRPRRWTARSQVAVAALAATTIGAGGLATWMAIHNPESADEQCVASGAGMRDSWSPEARRIVLGKLTAGGTKEGLAVADRVMAKLDGWAREWTAARIAVCKENFRTEGKQAARTAEELQCLRRRIGSFDAALVVITNSDGPELAEGAVETLEPVAGCEARDEITILDEERRTRWQPVIRDAIASHAAGQAGDFGKMGQMAAQALTKARQLGEPAPLALALQAMGEAQSAKGDFTEAAQTFRQAMRAAIAARDEDEVFNALEGILQMAWTGKLDPAEVEQTMFGAEVATLHLPATDTRRGEILMSIGGVRFVLLGDAAGARVALEEAVEFWTKLPGEKEQAKNIALAEGLLGPVLGALGEWDAATERLRHVLELAKPLPPPNGTAHTYSSLGENAVLLHKFDEAEGFLRQALTAAEAASAAGGEALNPVFLVSLAAIWASTGRCAAAAEQLERARPLALAQYGAESSTLGHIAWVEGLCLLERGRAREAVATLERAARLAAIWPHVNLFQVANTEFALARALLLAGAKGEQRQRAIGLAEKARRGLERYPGARLDREVVERWLGKHR